MTVPVKLSDILEAMEFQSDDTAAYLDRKTGRVLMIPAEDSDFADEMSEQEREASERIDKGDKNYVSLPDKFEIDEYDMMREFALSQEDAQVEDQLLDAIAGTGAFRMFKSAVRRLGIEKQWYKFRDDSYKQVARQWCESNKIPFVDDEPVPPA